MNAPEPKKKIALITHVDFWRMGSGDKARILTLVSYLGKRADLTVIYGGIEEPLDSIRLRALNLDFSLVYLERHCKLGIWEYATLLRDYLNKHPFDICMIEYVGFSFLLDYIPKGIKTILDTHDIASERKESFEKFGFLMGDMSWEEEIASFKRFDAVISIKPSDYDKISKAIGREKTLLAPHPVACSQQAIREKVTNIGFLGGEHIPNQDAITWFLSSVWPVVSKEGVKLNIYGSVGACLPPKHIHGVRVHGFVPCLNEIYRQTDIMINPVRFGAGIKIKNIEAIGNGLPLVTTSHGAMGMESGMGSAFLVADNKEEFSQHLISLIENPEKRKELGTAAYRFAREHFTEEKCFHPIIEAINSA